MSYRVKWTRRALAQANEMWEQSDDPDRVSQAIDDLVRALGHDPDQLGESRAGNVRIVFHGPFEVLFSVDLIDAKVKVRRILWYGP